MKFTTQADTLIIQLEGLEQLWALRQRLQIPRFAISEVDFLPQVPAMQDFRGYVRLPGSAWPGLFAAGDYRARGVREFWYVRMREPGVLTIVLKPGTFNYDKIRLTCTPEIAQDIADWWHDVN